MKGFLRGAPTVPARIVVTVLLSAAAFLISLLLREQMERTILDCHST
jgi:hypothetical protein